ncbi:hypothetical protein pb186bvf_002844 [Paramecium bursaria]
MGCIPQSQIYRKSTTQSSQPEAFIDLRDSCRSINIKINQTKENKGMVYQNKLLFPEDVNQKCDLTSSNPEPDIAASIELIKISQISDNQNHFQSQSQDLIVKVKKDLPDVSKSYQGILKTNNSGDCISKNNSGKKVEFNLQAIQIFSLEKIKQIRKRERKITMEDLDKQF